MYNYYWAYFLFSNESNAESKSQIKRFFDSLSIRIITRANKKTRPLLCQQIEWQNTIIFTWICTIPIKPLPFLKNFKMNHLNTFVVNFFIIDIITWLVLHYYYFQYFICYAAMVHNHSNQSIIYCRRCHIARIHLI